MVRVVAPMLGRRFHCPGPGRDRRTGARASGRRLTPAPGGDLGGGGRACRVAPPAGGACADTRGGGSAGARGARRRPGGAARANPEGPPSGDARCAPHAAPRSARRVARSRGGVPRGMPPVPADPPPASEGGVQRLVRHRSAAGTGGDRGLGDGAAVHLARGWSAPSGAWRSGPGGRPGRGGRPGLGGAFRAVSARASATGPA